MGKLLFDLLPVILFFVAFKIKGIFIATGVAIAASIIQIGFLLIQKKKVDPIQWISLGIIVVFGGATLLAHNESFIKLKPTVLYFTFALVLLVSQFLLKKIPLKALLGTKLELTEKSWGGVNLSWGIFFVVLGIINLFMG